MLKAWGAHVTVTCSQNAEQFVKELGADHVVDYTAGPVEEPLSALEKWDNHTHTHTCSHSHRDTHLQSFFIGVGFYLELLCVCVNDLPTCYYIYIRPLVLQNLIVLTVKLFLCSYLPSHPFLFALTNPPFMYIYLLVSLLFINPAPLHLKIWLDPG